MSEETLSSTKILQEFKSLLLVNDEQGRQFYKEDIHSDYCLDRFIKARPGNLAASLKMFNNWQEWRIRENVDAIHEQRFDNAKEIQELYPRFFHGLDKQGRPIWIKRHFNFNLTKIMELGGADWEKVYLQHHIRENEKLINYRFPACSVSAKRNVDKVLLIMDIKGFPVLSLPRIYSLLSTVSQIDADYYPETLGKILVLNAGILFAGFWKVIKTFLPAETAAKVNILGSNFQSELLELIDVENLPAFLGGNCTCSHIEGGCEGGFVDSGPWNDGSAAPLYPQSKWEDLEWKPQPTKIELEKEASSETLT